MTNVNTRLEDAFEDLAPVKVYLDVIAGSHDPDEVRAAVNIYDSVFHINSPAIKSWENHSNRLSFILSQVLGEESGEDTPDSLVFQIEKVLSGGKTYPLEDQELFARRDAITHVVRRMVQGNQDFPRERFGEVIDLCVAALMSAAPDISERKARRFIRREIRQVEGYRSAEALKLVGAPSRLVAYKIGARILGLVPAPSDH